MSIIFIRHFRINRLYLFAEIFVSPAILFHFLVSKTFVTRMRTVEEKPDSIYLFLPSQVRKLLENNARIRKKNIPV